MTAAAASSHSSHHATSLGKLGEALVAVGDGSNADYNLAVELWEGGRWTSGMGAGPGFVRVLRPGPKKMAEYSEMIV